MNTLKQYGWVLQVVGAALLVALALFLQFGNGEDIIVPFLGGVIIIAAVIRLIPYVKTQKNDLIKTINIIEITIDVGIGLTLILVELLVDQGLGNLFGYLIGIYLMLRGSVHFYGVSSHKEQSDLPIYFFHIAALIVGSFVFFQGNFTPAVLIYIILFFSVVAAGYLSWGGYKGYKVYRYQKTMTMPDQAHVDEPTVEKRVPTQPEPEVEEPVQDHVA
ncbi:hypothetical protein [Candidatus Xianfuyuplasma coldseepsis]|uniref:DUF308 domain-containing protein n=1 Tax=Candidatus Xianfuyuplasma coldseepsis TaxID=2782163 RepID=A0A7L7KTT7_9MOLU|nr:hypothetical protein [Xianfuyuplasma coldseepsis]QMS85722.1 hypothetical protein G4Z02_08180 [Xianfuyuplasma coldseepsis]